MFTGLIGEKHAPFSGAHGERQRKPLLVEAGLIGRQATADLRADDIKQIGSSGGLRSRGAACKVDRDLRPRKRLAYMRAIDVGRPQ
jgi:hypothetical protein